MPELRDWLFAQWRLKGVVPTPGSASGPLAAKVSDVIDMTSSTEFVAPLTEVGRVDAYMDVVAHGDREITLVVGEARVGKSRLKREVAGRARMRGLRIAMRRFVEIGEEVRPPAWLREIVARLGRGHGQ